MGLGIMWGETFTDFEPCHACVQTYGGGTLLAELPRNAYLHL